MSDAKLLEVYRAKDSVGRICSRLALRTLESRRESKGRCFDALAGAISFGWPTSPRLLVSEADAPRARTILMEIEHETGASDA